MEFSSQDNSVSFVQETKTTPDFGNDEAEIEGNDGSSFESISVTREEVEVVSEPIDLRQRKGKKCRGRDKRQGWKKRRNDVNRGEERIQMENGDVDLEVIKVMEIGVQLGINFNGKEREMVEFFRRKEVEDAGRCGQNGGQ